MRLAKAFISYFRSVSDQELRLGPLTVLFGKNNAGKTNMLEAIYAIMAPHDIPDAYPERGLRGHGDIDIATAGAVYVDLQLGLPFDDAILNATAHLALEDDDNILRSCALPPRQVCCTCADRGSELWFIDIAKFIKQSDSNWRVLKHQEDMYDLDEHFRSSQAPRPRPLFLGWELDNFDETVTEAVANLPQRSPWWDPPTWDDEHSGSGSNQMCIFRNPESDSWLVDPALSARLTQLEELATSLLPDFIMGNFRVDFGYPQTWKSTPAVRVRFIEPGASEERPLYDFGRGAYRWLVIAVQVALRIMDGDHHTTDISTAGAEQFSGNVLFIDEPESHLHPPAVASVVRWAQNLVFRGFNIVAASHHEEFLRASGDGVTFVHIFRDAAGETKAHTMPSAAAGILQELADQVGLHPATALSLRRAILFVEGPLDVAVLNEYAGHELEAAGVTLIPLHGTRSLPGLVDSEFAPKLGIKTGVLTDNTDTATIWDRINKDHQTEEKKILRLIKNYEAQGLTPPTPFGVREDDLLFALPADAIREYLKGPFPGWNEMKHECYLAEGVPTSVSVNWKQYALDQYGLPITTAAGVQQVVHALNQAGVELPSIRAVVDEIVAWANQ
jgi:hypothetical protein